MSAPKMRRATAAKRPAIPEEPPDRLSDAVAEIWRENVGRAGGFDPKVDAALFEAYCTLVSRWRATAKAVADDGIVVGDEKKGAIVHPALAAERQLSEQIKEWAPLFNRRPSPSRRSGPMYDATRTSIQAAQLDKDERYAGACAGVLTIAWLIDEAQRDGVEALQKASYVLIPNYLKGCADLQITPASVPDDVRKKATSGGKVDKFQKGAQQRRLTAV